MLNPSKFRTENAAHIYALLSAAAVPAYNSVRELEHGLITSAPLVTENATLFSQAHFSEPETTYALGWKDPAGYDRLSEFVAPPMIPAGELYQHIEYPNAEAFLSDSADDDLRAIGAEFKTVEYTETKALRQVPNRGLRIVVDYDRVKTMPNWQRMYTDRLLQRLMRNAARRKVVLALAAGVAVSKTWGSTADPDLDIANEAKNSGDITGISPNRGLFGLAAKLLRYSSYGAQATAAGFGGRALSPEEAMQKIGLEALVDESRYQSGTSKTAIVGSKVLLFSGYGVSGEDPSNFKTARANTSQGGRFAVYARQIGVKFWEVVVECYEMEWVASTLGVRTVTVS
jgi:hypothetical protein